MSFGANAIFSWADIARGRPIATTSAKSPLLVDAPSIVDGEDSSPVLATGEADAIANSQPWGNLSQRVASAFASTADEEGVTEDEGRVEEEVAQQGVPFLPEVENPRLQRLKPAPFGAKLSPCQGEVLVVFGHYGWLTTPHKVDHPAAARNGGRIYFHVRDVVDNVSLVEGDRVDFYLYVDEQGLGAEELSLQRWDAMPDCSPVGMRAGAVEFVPKAHSMPPVSSVVESALPLHAFVFNHAYWSDDSDTDSSIESEVDQLGYLTDDSVSDSGVVACKADRRADLHRKLWKKKCRAHSHGSSSTGSPSDSDMYASDGPPPGLYHPTFRPPPGLSL